MKLACVKILLLGHQGFTDGFLLLVILHNAWWRLNIGRDLFFHFPLLFQRTIQFRRNLCTGLVVCFYVPKERSDVLSLGWSKVHVGCCGPQSDVGMDITLQGSEGLIPTGPEASPQLPQFLQTKGGPNPRSLSAHLIRKTFPGTQAQNKSSSDSRSEPWEGNAEGCLQGLARGDSCGFLPQQVNIKAVIVWKVRLVHRGSILDPGHWQQTLALFHREESCHCPSHWPWIGP